MKNKLLLTKLVLGLAGLVATAGSLQQLELNKAYAVNVNISNEEYQNDSNIEDEDREEDEDYDEIDLKSKDILGLFKRKDSSQFIKQELKYIVSCFDDFVKKLQKELKSDSFQNVSKYVNKSVAELNVYVDMFLLMCKMSTYYNSTENIVKDELLSELVNKFLLLANSSVDSLLKFVKMKADTLNSEHIVRLNHNISNVIKKIKDEFYNMKFENVCENLNKLNNFNEFKLLELISDQIDLPIFYNIIREIDKEYILDVNSKEYKSVSLKLRKLKNDIHTSKNKGFVLEYLSNMRDYLQYSKELIEDKILNRTFDLFAERVGVSKEIANNKDNKMSDMCDEKFENCLSNLVEILSSLIQTITDNKWNFFTLSNEKFKQLTELMSAKNEKSDELTKDKSYKKGTLTNRLKQVNFVPVFMKSVIEYIDEILSQCEEFKNWRVENNNDKELTSAYKKVVDEVFDE